MDVAIKVPEDIVRQLEAGWGDVSRRALETLATDGYRSGLLTSADVQRMLDLSSRWEAELFLKREQAYLDYDEDDLLSDIEAIRKPNRQ